MMRMKTRNPLMALPLAAAIAFGGCNTKPEPEKNCIDKGKMVACPMPILILQREIYCVDNGKIRMLSGKIFDPKYPITGVSAKIKELDGLYEIELKIPAGTVGYDKSLKCETLLK